MMRRTRIAAASVMVAAGLIGAVAAPAFAGEATGSAHGGPDKDGTTPINEYRAGSICSFSGLNDDPSGGGDPSQAGQVQNWGATVEFAKAFFGDGDHGANEIARVFKSEGPGTACRGYASGG